jgi:hypothetical protein
LASVVLRAEKLPTSSAIIIIRFNMIHSPQDSNPSCGDRWDVCGMFVVWAALLFSKMHLLCQNHKGPIATFLLKKLYGNGTARCVSRWG